MLLLLLPRQILLVQFLLIRPLFQHLLFLVFTELPTLPISRGNALFVPLVVCAFGNVWRFE